MNAVLIAGAHELWPDLPDQAECGLEMLFLPGPARASEKLADPSIVIFVLECPEHDHGETDLLEWVKTNRPDLECILLAHPVRFCQVAEVLPRNIYRIISPVSAVELNAVICRTKLKLELIARENHQHNPTVRNYQEKQFWVHLLQGMIAADARALTLAGHPTGFDYRAGQQVLPILLTHRGWRRRHSQAKMDALLFGAKKMSDKLLTSRLGGISLSYRPDSLLVLIYQSAQNSKTSGEELKAICHELTEACFQYFDSNIACYIGSWCQAHDLPAQADVLWAGDRDNIMHPRGIFTRSQIHEHRPPFSLPEPRNWMFYFNEGRADEFIRCIEEYFEKTIAAGSMTGWFLTGFQQDLLQEVLFALKEAGITSSRLFSDNDLFLQMADARRSVPAMLDWVRELTVRGITLIARGGISWTVAQRACNYINHSLNQPITRQALAQALFLSQNHIARAFRQETGMSIADYITQQRIQLACRMLQQTEIPPGEIAERSGFQDYSYFYKAFVRATGLAPSDYKKINAQSGNPDA